MKSDVKPKKRHYLLEAECSLPGEESDAKEEVSQNNDMIEESGSVITSGHGHVIHF